MNEAQKARLVAVQAELKATYPHADDLLLCLALHDLHKQMLRAISQTDHPTLAILLSHPTADLEGGVITRFAEVHKLAPEVFYRHMGEIRVRYEELRQEFEQMDPDPAQAAKNMKLN